MANNLLNLAFRFLLELVALTAMGYWGYHRFQDGMRFLTAILVPLIAALVWGTFRISSESPRGRAPVAVTGPVRLLIEALFFGFSVWGLFNAGAVQVGWIFGIALLIHYGLSYDRLVSLLIHLPT